MIFNLFPWKRSPALRRAILLAALALGAASSTTQAAVTPVGDVRPFDLLATPLINEGLPPNGNQFNAGEGLTAQTNWENNDVVVGYADINAGIVVGQRSFGRLDIDGNSQLRYQTLVIGDEGMVGDQLRQGTGFMVITGLNALYNNDPNVFAPQFAGVMGEADDRRDAELGFDLYVGLSGVGILEIRAGGRAEIQDLTVIGDQQGSTGSVLVDGFASSLFTGGFEATGGPINAARQMTIGRQGIGTMTISNGGTVVTEAAAAGDPQNDTVAAVIGGDVFDGDSEPEEGGRGTVHVTGPSSKWFVGGTLQIGGWHEQPGPFGLSSGENALYDSTVGRGTLRISDGAFVDVRPAIDADPIEDPLRVIIGRFGRLELEGGYLNIGDPGFREDNIALENDGVIMGGGRIDTALFRNRYFGEIRVGPAQKLLIDSTSEFEGDPDLTPMINFGLIEVLGTADQRAEMEFERAPDTVLQPIQPFINRTAPIDPLRIYDGGLISAQHSTLRFRSGILNEGSMVFSEGMNIITGRVDNITGPNRNGLFFIGSNTTVLVEDEFSSGGIASDAVPGAQPILSVAAGGTLLTADSKSLTIAGLLEMEMSFNNPSKIQVAGDLGVNATLLLSFASDAISTLSHGDVFELMSFSGDVGGVDFTNLVQLAPNLAVNPVLNVVTDANFNLQFPTLDLIAMPILQSYYLFALDPSMVGIPGGPGAMGADFNGDGFVDAADLAIWQMNVGITTGASVLQGDADGDGDVDGDDLILWQQTIGPVPGAGGGAGAGGGQNLAVNVPEPSAMMLLISSGLLGFVYRQRRSR